MPKEMIKSGKYLSLISLILLSGCAIETGPRPTSIEVANSINSNSYKIDENLMHYHINKKKTFYSVKKIDPSAEKSPLLAREGQGFKDVTVPEVKNSKNSFLRNFKRDQNKI